jgi:hypothetical protein
VEAPQASVVKHLLQIPGASIVECQGSGTVVELRREFVVARVIYNPSRSESDFPLPTHLATIQTDGRHEGEGLMRSLLEEILAASDACDLGVSLEASNLGGNPSPAELVSIYKRFGFLEIMSMPGQIMPRMVRPAHAFIS